MNQKYFLLNGKIYFLKIWQKGKQINLTLVLQINQKNLLSIFIQLMIKNIYLNF